jgi:phosphatidylinositol-3-phosphatase
VKQAPGIRLAVLAFAALVGGCLPGAASPAASGLPITTPATTASSALAPVPAFSYVWVIVMENTGFDRVVGAADAPFLNDLIARGGLATAYHGVGRPSQPNYLALFSGSTHGIADNDLHDIDAPTIADQLEGAGLTWREYAENVPSGCYLGATADGGRDGDGRYVRKHAPAISFTAIAGDPARCSNVSDLTAFDPSVGGVSLIIPNMCHSMHDCSIADGDAWLADFVPRITESAAFRAGGALFVTFDEGDPDDAGGGRPAMIVVSPLVTAGTVSDIPHDHYSLLRTIEEGFGLDCLANACVANTLAEFFGDR